MTDRLDDSTKESKAAPTLTPCEGGFSVRLRYGNGARKRVFLPFMDQAKAQRRAVALQAMAKALVKAGKVESAVTLLEKAAPASDHEFQTFARIVEAEAGRPIVEAPKRNAVTFQDFADSWTSGALHRQFPDQVALIGQEDNVLRLEKHIFPVVGGKELADISREDCDEVMRQLPAGLSRSTRRHYAGLLNRVLNLAELAGHIDRNPLPRGWLPKPSPKKRFPILYPREDATLLACQAIPLAHRVLYGFLHREGMRRSEAERLTWADVDLENGTVRLDENKTKHSRWWKLAPGVAEALGRWKQHSTGGTLVFGDVPNFEHLAQVLREHLRAAGLERDDLYSTGDNKGAFGVHSFRRSFVTRSLASGRGEDFVRQRTGHKSEELLRYRQAANALAELELGDVALLVEAIPELNSTPSGPMPGPVGGPRSLETVTGATPNSPVISTMCARKGSNLHALRRRNLNPVRLPIPPLARGGVTIVALPTCRKRYP